MTILSFVAGILAHLIYRAADAEIERRETAMMEELEHGLLGYIADSRIIPGTNDWANAVSEFIGKPLIAIEATDQGNPRRLLAHPDFWDVGSGVLPYVQGPRGVEKPLNPRLILISSVGLPLPTAPLNFDETWRVESGGILSTNAPWDTWEGDWSDVTVQRMDLSRMFHHVSLSNGGREPEAGYLVDAVGMGDGAMRLDMGFLDGYFLTGTGLELCVGAESVALAVVDSDQSYIYNRGRWRSQLTESAGPSAQVSWSVGAALRDWVDTYEVEFTDLWLDRRQDRFDFIIAEVEHAAPNGAENEVDPDSSDHDSDDGDSDDGDSDDGDSDDGDSDDGDSDDGEGSARGQSNNGHGNNVDGVDVSNPGRGRGGPNGEEDPSGDVDDERPPGGG